MTDDAVKGEPPTKAEEIDEREREQIISFKGTKAMVEAYRAKAKEKGYREYTRWMRETLNKAAGRKDLNKVVRGYARKQSIPPPKEKP